MKPAFKNVAIVGLGLMGASCARALKARSRSVSIFGVSRNRAKIKEAIKKGIIQSGDISLENLLQTQSLDLIIIATPVSTIVPLVKSIERATKKKIIVTDVGSTKSSIVAEIEKANCNYVSFVGSHPMAGSHESGMLAAHKDLYRNSLCFITATKKSDPKAIQCVTRLWRIMGARTVVMSPREHDRIVSSISHLPHALAALLMETVRRSNPRSFPYAGQGFFDTTRIAQSDPQMWHDIFLSNTSNIVNDIRAFQKVLDRFVETLNKNRSSELHSLLSSSQIKRKEIQKKRTVR